MNESTAGMDMPEETSGPVKRAMLAALGAVALAYDAAEDTYDRMVDRGRQVESELEERAQDMRRQNMGTRNRVGESFLSVMDTVLNSLNLPSKSDLDTINTKLNIVNRKLDDIQLERVEPAESTVVPIITPDMIEDEPT